MTQSVDTLPDLPPIRLLACISIVSFALFVLLAWIVHGENALTQFYLEGVTVAHEWKEVVPELEKPAYFLIHLAGPEATVGWAFLGGFAFLAYRRNKRALVWVVTMLIAGVLIEGFLKPFLQRPHPPFTDYHGTFSFPSTHSTRALIVCGMLGILLGDCWSSRNRWLAMWCVLSAFVVGVGASKVFVGRHWPSDILAGYLFGLGYLAGVLLLVHWLERFKSGYSAASSGSRPSARS